MEASFFSEKWKRIQRNLKEKPRDIPFLITVLVMAAAAFIVYFATAYNLTSGYDVPDEEARRLIPFYLVNHGTLPTGFELELNSLNDYGFSYASYPPLPALLSAFFIKAASFATQNERLLIVASRMGNVLLGVVSVIYLMKLGKLLFKSIPAAAAMAVFVGFMPQVIYLSGYYNADSISLCSVILILYYLVLGSQRGWSVGTCVKLALAMSMCVLTYYNAYGWCLIAVIYCIVSVVRDPAVKNKPTFILKRGALIAGILIVLCSWYFIRNAILYDGDFLAISIRGKIAEITASAGYTVNPLDPYCDRGSLLDMLLKDSQWLTMTAKSLIGVFGRMDIYLSEAQYILYGGILVFGLLFAVPSCVRDKGKHVFYLLMIIGMIIPVMLSVWYSYASDYQPQVRYIITILPALAVFVINGYREAGRLLAKVLKRDTVRTVRMTLCAAAAMWVILLLPACQRADASGAFTKNALTYEVDSLTQEVHFTYEPAENERVLACDFAIWYWSDEPEWYQAEFDGDAWTVDWPYEGLKDGEYNIHIYAWVRNGQQKCKLMKSFEIVDGKVAVTVSGD